MNIGTNYYNIYSQYNTLFQKSSSTSKASQYAQLFGANNLTSSSSSTLGSSALQYITDLKNSSKGMKSALNSLSAGSLSRRGMVSSDESALTVKSSGTQYGSQSVSVKVDSVATKQVNEGNTVKSSDLSGLTGKNTFELEVGGKTKQLSINVGSADTNKDVQQKMADAINSAGLGVTASVVTDSDKKTSTLKIESKNTGDSSANKFTLTDKQGGAVSKLSADNTTQQAQNAVYSVNGGEQKTSATNDISLGSGLSVTLKKATENEVNISVGVDKSYAKSKLKDFVDSYNEMYSAAANNAESDPKAARLFSRLVNTSKSYASQLGSIGVEFDKDGRMSVNSDKLTQAADNGTLEKYLKDNSGKNYGFMGQMSRLADNVSGNTSNYVSKSAIGDSLTSNFSYSSYGSLVQYNYLSAGSLLDYMF